MTEHDMWSCPGCGTEYVRDVGTCADCGTKLVAGAAEPFADEPVELCPILDLDNPGDIAFAKSMLGSAGITYHMRGEGVHALYGGSVTGTALFGAVKVMVDKSRADEAVHLLADMISHDWGQDSAGGGAGGGTGDDTGDDIGDDIGGGTGDDIGDDTGDDTGDDIGDDIGDIEGGVSGGDGP